MSCSSDAFTFLDFMVVAAIFWATFLAVVVASLLVVARRESSRESREDRAPRGSFVTRGAS